MPGVVQRFLCSLSQFNADLQNTLTKSILIFLSETFQVTIFTPKLRLRQLRQNSSTSAWREAFRSYSPKEMNASNTCRGRGFAETSSFTETQQSKDAYLEKSWGPELWKFRASSHTAGLVYLNSLLKFRLFLSSSASFFSCFSLEKPN